MAELKRCYESDRSEFVIVYGRRRVGKTFLVDTFFENQGIGGQLIEFAIRQKGCRRLWVLEKNDGARRFYARHGFTESGERQLEEGTDEYIIELRL